MIKLIDLLDESLPNKIKDKYKKMKDEPETDAGKDFSQHHAGSQGSGQMGLWAEPDTYDWDDDDEEEEGGWQKDSNKQKRGYEPVEGKVIKLKDLIEDITLPVKVGDTILVGRFKNKKMVVKSIGKDKHGMPTINGRKATTFRILKSEE